jgi:hypothetical protein
VVYFSGDLDIPATEAMVPFKYPCFISYRHRNGSTGRGFTESIIEELRDELELHIDSKPYIDSERMKGAEFYNETLATELCHSVCMVVLFSPNYISQEHTFCAREYIAMEQLEARRLQLLEEASERRNSLIVCLALRGFELIPPEIKGGRRCIDLEAQLRRSNMRSGAGFQRAIKETAIYIRDRWRAFLEVEQDPCAECEGFHLPSEQQVMPWIRRTARPSVPFPYRGVK